MLPRIVRGWKALSSERRLAALGACSLFLTLFLPWYSVSVSSAKRLTPTTKTFTGWEAFSFVEAAVLLVAVSVLVLLFQRVEGRAFHLPGGDGTIITVAGAWTCFLVIWRMFDKQGVTASGQVDLSSGIEWGIFVALLAAAALAYAGIRIRAAHQPEPPLPTEHGAVFDGRWHEPVRAQVKRERYGSPTLAARRRDEDAPPRSSWSPAEAPEWSESERPIGWLTAQRDPDVASPDGDRKAAPDP